MYHAGGDIDNGEICACVETELIWKISVPSPKFCYDPEVLGSKK